MNSIPIKSRENRTKGIDSVDFGKWTLIIFLAHAIGMAIFIGLAKVALKLPTRELFVPYTVLAYCGLVLSPLLYWARLSRQRPKSCAMRCGIAMFFYFQALILAMAYGTIRLGILSLTTAVRDYVPFLIPFSALVSIVLYVTARQILEAPKTG